MPHMGSVALPVLPGKADRVRNISHEIAARRADWDRLCQEAGGFQHYSVTLQESPAGDLCIYSMLLDEPGEVRMKFGGTAYDEWWLGFVKDVHGIDLNDVTSLPPTVFAWHAGT